MKKIRSFFSKYLQNCKYGFLIFVVGIVVCIFDLITKVITDGKNVTFIKGFISIYSSHNTGAAWSILSENTWILIVLSIIFIAVILVANWYFKGKNLLYSYAIGLILGGAICNLIDRIVFGYVRDFIKLDFVNFPIFNLADCAITIGVILLCVFLICYTPKEQKTKTENISIVVDEKNQNDEKVFNKKTTKKSNKSEIISNNSTKTASTKKRVRNKGNLDSNSSTEKKNPAKNQSNTATKKSNNNSTVKAKNTIKKATTKSTKTTKTISQKATKNTKSQKGGKNE